MLNANVSCKCCMPMLHGSYQSCNNIIGSYQKKLHDRIPTSECCMLILHVNVAWIIKITQQHHRIISTKNDMIEYRHLGYDCFEKLHSQPLKQPYMQSRNIYPTPHTSKAPTIIQLLSLVLISLLRGW
jgi:hypothetical protein